MSQPNRFSTLGKHLQYVRQERQQTVAEVSGAVEIDEKTLVRIESGEERPSEDVLLLLISHFGVQDQEAVQLWELADYGGEIPEQLRPEIDANGKIVMLLAMDLRTLYSDSLEISATPAGLTLNFTQATSQDRATPVARIGMSYEQAERVLQQLHHSLFTAHEQRQRRLPPGQSPDKSL